MPFFVEACAGKRNDDSTYLPAGLQISFIRGTINLDSLVKLALREYQEFSRLARPSAFTFISGSAGQIKTGFEAGAPPTSKAVIGFDLTTAGRPVGVDMREFAATPSTMPTLEAMALSPAMETFIDEVGTWFAHRDWYLARGIPWRRGYVLFGPPGTGKTSLVRGLSEKFKLPVYSYDLATLFNSELRTEWNSMLIRSPVIALFEDIDAVFDGRENRAGTPLTFDCVMNCIDGVERTDGLLVIVTTNRIESLDPAFCAASFDTLTGSQQVSRPGRIDRIIACDCLDEAGRRKICGRLLAEWPDMWNPIIAAGDGDTGAQFQERCVQTALRRFWDRKQRRAKLRATEPPGTMCCQR